LDTCLGRLPSGEYTEESQLPGDEYTGESRLPGDEYTEEEEKVSATCQYESWPHTERELAVHGYDSWPYTDTTAGHTLIQELAVH
jgi:hypothetical protein